MKTILVTGASSGIGKSTAQKLLQEGRRVYVAARRLEQMQDLEAQGATALAMDITKEEDVQRVVATIQNESGGVDVLVNNAGYAIYGAVEDITIDEARRQFEVNLFGLARLTQLVLPYMRQQGRGTIINMSSIGGKMYTPLGAWYHATKHALEGWSDCLRLELEPLGINVVIIEPGVIITEFGEVMLEPMVERSQGGPYQKLANRLAKATRANYARGGGSEPQVIAEVVAKAVRASRPKTRYAKGKFAKPMLFLRKVLPDRLYDKAVMSQVK